MAAQGAQPILTRSFLFSDGRDSFPTVFVMSVAIPKSAALVDLAQGKRIDRTQLDELVAARAFELRELGAGPGSRLVICHDNSTAILIDILAIWHLGAIAVPLSTSLIAAERERLAVRLRPKLWIGEGGPAEVQFVELVNLQGGDAPANKLPAQPSPDDSTALILWTSGTTGQPKGVVLSHGALRRRLRANIKHIGEHRLASALQLLPLHFGHGLIGNALTPLAAGATLHLGLQPGMSGLADLGRVIDDHSISFLTSVPSLWRVALKVSNAPKRDTLTRVHVGSERLPTPLWQSIASWAGGADVYNMYGMTESSNWISGVGGAEANFVEGAVGTPWEGAFNVLSEDGAVLTTGTGEVVVQSPSLMSGYLDDAKGTSSVLSDGWLRTGDIGELDANGALRLVGRIKNQINNAGIKVSAEAVEQLLESHPDIREACAFGRADAVSGEVVAAAVVAQPDRAIDASKLRRWCEDRIRREAVPATIHIVDALPRNTRGKLDRASLIDSLIGGTGGAQ